MGVTEAKAILVCVKRDEQEEFNHISQVRTSLDVISFFLRALRFISKSSVVWTLKYV